MPPSPPPRTVRVCCCPLQGVPAVDMLCNYFVAHPKTLEPVGGLNSEVFRLCGGDSLRELWSQARAIGSVSVGTPIVVSGGSAAHQFRLVVNLWGGALNADDSTAFALNLQVLYRHFFATAAQHNAKRVALSVIGGGELSKQGGHIREVSEATLVASVREGLSGMWQWPELEEMVVFCREAAAADRLRQSLGIVVVRVTLHLKDQLSSAVLLSLLQSHTMKDVVCCLRAADNCELVLTGAGGKVLEPQMSVGDVVVLCGGNVPLEVTAAVPKAAATHTIQTAGDFLVPAHVELVGGVEVPSLHAEDAIGPVVGIPTAVPLASRLCYVFPRPLIGPLRSGVAWSPSTSARHVSSVVEFTVETGDDISHRVRVDFSKASNADRLVAYLYGRVIEEVPSAMGMVAVEAKYPDGRRVPLRDNRDLVMLGAHATCVMCDIPVPGGDGVKEIAWGDIANLRPLADDDPGATRCCPGATSEVEVLTGTYFGVRVAVKRMADATPSATDGLRKEVQALMRFSHPHVVRLIGMCSQPTGVVTEFCARGNLSDILHVERRKLPMRLRLSIARDIATSLSYLHSQRPIRCIHRNIKSTNVLLNESMRAALADFGSAKFTDAPKRSDSVPQTGDLSVAYLAPEILRGEPTTCATDMFSFGVLLWEVLQGDVPWAGVDPRTLTRRIAQGERLQVSSSWASSLQGLVLQCIHDDPDKRATAHVALDVLTSEMMQLEDSSAPPEQFLCPVSMEVMTDPVTTPCGTTYERSVIISCLSRQLVDPMTMQPCTPQQLIPNRCLKQLIEAWTEHSGRK